MIGQLEHPHGRWHLAQVETRKVRAEQSQVAQLGQARQASAVEWPRAVLEVSPGLQC